VIMPLALLHEELDLDLRPEALYALCFIPAPDLETNAKGYLVTLTETFEHTVDALARGRLPVLDAAVVVGNGVEAKRGLWCRALGGGRVGRRQERERGREIGSRRTREGVENVARDWRGHRSGRPGGRLKQRTTCGQLVGGADELSEKRADQMTVS
jgi:hypothetical protein